MKPSFSSIGGILITQAKFKRRAQAYKNEDEFSSNSSRKRRYRYSSAKNLHKNKRLTVPSMMEISNKNGGEHGSTASKHPSMSSYHNGFRLTRNSSVVRREPSQSRLKTANLRRKRRGKNGKKSKKKTKEEVDKLFDRLHKTQPEHKRKDDNFELGTAIPVQFQKDFQSKR